MGIININVLEQAERETTDRNSLMIQKQHPPYGLYTMIYIHRMLFSSLYQWAGEIRRVGISKTDTKSGMETRFCVPERIEAEASKLFRMLNKDFSQIKYWSLDEAADKLAYHYGELNILHPFREGNGRTQRILFEFIAEDIGYEIRWPDNRDEWISANVSAYTTDHKALCEIFLDTLEPAQI